MFVSGIKITEHHQFKDFELDLTYPEGHEKAGWPLEKVCFIGQSGTGKTTLLEELADYNDIGDRFRSTLPIQSGCIEIMHDTYPSSFNLLGINNKSFKSAKLNSFTIQNCSPDINGWTSIKNKIAAHQNQKIAYSRVISEAYMKGDTKKADLYVQRLRKWQADNDTPLQDLADDYLNPILKDFNLQVKTTIQSLEESENIHLENRTTLETIPLEYWSTGVQNIIARTIPLYTHKFKEAIICIDEPENSLYPDIQRKIIDIYRRLAPDSQLFFATHSPIIAASFEPWEIVELKFNDEGYVYRELYYEGENHVDNYKYYPQYLRWDAILQNIFDLENDGSDERKKMLQDFTDLDTQLKARKAKGEKLTKEDPDVKRLLEMGKKLGWDTKKG